MSRHPEVKWAQRSDKIYLTVELPDARNPKVNIQPEGKFTFSATAGPGNTTYELDLQLFDKINAEESKISEGLRHVFCVLIKAEKKWWKKLLSADAKPPPYLKADWDKWVDEDEENERPGNEFDKFDMSSMGGFGGGGMGDPELDALGGADESDSDDEDADTSPKQNVENKVDV